MAAVNQPPDSREEEFLRLFAQAQRPLHAYILALVFDHNTAADLLQEVNIVLWRKFDQYQLGTSFFAWAREIARLSVLRHRQASSGKIATLDPHVLEDFATRFSEDVNESDGRRDALNSCLKKLRPVDQELVLSRYRDGATVTSIAQQLGRTVNGVSQSLGRIRHLLAECIERMMRSEERAN